MNGLRVILKNLLRRKTRSLLTVAGVAAAVAAGVALVSLAWGFERTWLAALQNRGVDLIVLRVGVADRAASSLDEEWAARLLELPGVSEVSPGLTDRVPLAGAGALGVPVHGLRHNSFVLRSFTVVAGRELQPSDTRGVLLGQELARSTGHQPGDSLELEGDQFIVVGLFATPSRIENNSAAVLLPTLQQLMDRAGQVNQIQVKLASPADREPTRIAALRGAIEQLADAAGHRLGLTAMACHDFVGRAVEIRLARGMAVVTAVLALLLGAVGVLNTMLMSVFERTREIGILRAIGWRTQRIVRMILGETALLCLTGGGLGLAVGLALVTAFCRSPAVGRLIEPDTSFELLATGLALACAVGLAGGVYPAWRGARLLPTEALRYE